MTKAPASTGTPGVTREFVGMDSPTARRAGSGGHPCQGLYHRGVGRKPKVAMISDDFAGYWAEICSLPIELITHMVKQAQRQGFCAREDDPHLMAVAMVSMLNQFCYTQLSGGTSTATVDDTACITTLANFFYRTIYHKEAGLT